MKSYWFCYIIFLQKITRKVKVNMKLSQSRTTLCDPWLYSLSNSPGQNSGMGVLLSRIFPTQRLPQVSCIADSFPAEPQVKPEEQGRVVTSSPVDLPDPRIEPVSPYYRWFIYQLNIREAQMTLTLIVFTKWNQSFLEILITLV